MQLFSSLVRICNSAKYWRGVSWTSTKKLLHKSHEKIRDHRMRDFSGMELVRPNKRVMGGAVIVWAYALQDWRQLLVATYAPALLFVFYIW
jgi:hypothetical protein